MGMKGYKTLTFFICKSLHITHVTIIIPLQAEALQNVEKFKAYASHSKLGEMFKCVY